ncbi:MAG: hypothetical protein ACI857_003138 [Arenicella sp.]|jgi:hypothetical protein
MLEANVERSERFAEIVFAVLRNRHLAGGRIRWPLKRNIKLYLTMLKHFTLLIILFSWAQKSVAQKPSTLFDDYYQSRHYHEAIGVELAKTLDVEKCKQAVQAYLKEKLSPYMTYEQSYFKANFAAHYTGDSTVNHYLPERFVFIECGSTILINGFISYHMTFLLDSNYQLLRGPMQIEDYDAKEIGKIKKFEELKAKVEAMHEGFVTPIASFSLMYDYESFEYYYKVISKSDGQKYHERKVMGKYWKRHEQMYKYLLINPINGESLKMGYELRTVDTNGPN